MDLVFTIIILLFVIVYFFTCDTTEEFSNTATKIGDMSRNELEATIYQIYKADVLAIKNLADTATKLQVGGLTIPGNLGINGNQKVDGTMHIKGATTIGGGATINGGGTINGGATINGTTSWASMITNPIAAGLTIQTTTGSQKLYLGAYYTGGAGSGSAIQSSDFYSSKDNPQTLYLNPLGGGVTISGGCQLKGGDGDTGTGGIVFHNTVNMKRKDGTYTHFDWADKKNYIRGDTIINGDLTIGKGSKITFEDGGYLKSYTVPNQTPGVGIFNSSYWGSVIVGDGNILWRADMGGGFDGRGGLNWCDRRIKENIIEADTNNILTKINKLPMQNYNFIDKKFYKGQEVYGLIAQEVKEVFPEAVEINKQHIPNINKLASHQLVEDNVILTVDNKTNVDDNLQLFVNDRPINAIVIKATENTITVSKWEEYKDDDKVLVYGTEIDDFHGLNQQYMGILSLGGIQELTKKIEYLTNELNKLKNKK